LSGFVHCPLFLVEIFRGNKNESAGENGKGGKEKGKKLGKMQ